MKQIFSAFTDAYVMIAVVAVMLTGYSVITSGMLPKRYVDEKVHVSQVQRIYKGDHTLIARMSTLPGYHYITAGVIHVMEPILGFPKVTSFHVRAVGVLYTAILMGVVSALLGALLLKREKVLLVLSLPILAPYLFLGYTEVLSLTVVLLSFILFLKERLLWSALMLAVAIFIRQDNMIWPLMFIVLGGVHHISAWRSFGWSELVAFTKKSIWYVLVLAGAGVFFFLNGGVATGDADAHSPTFDANNVFFFLILFAVIFAPTILAAHREVAVLVCRKYKTVVGIVGVVGIVYTTTFFVKHSYNLNDFFLHNAVLQHFSATTAGAITGIALSVLAIIFLWSETERGMVQRKYLPAIFLFGALFLALHPLTVHRYAVIPMTLIALLITYRRSDVFWMQVIYSLIISAMLYWGAFGAQIFKL